MENAGYLPGINLHQHDSGLLCAFVHVYITLYLSLLQTGSTALGLASKFNHIDVVQFLIESGAQVNKV